jgi:TIR domain
MADVFISYRKADRARAQALANALKVENLDVWWDVALETGETFDEKIQGVLEKCKAVIVLWSKESVKSDWVRAESSIGRERGILVPVMIQPVNIPVPFNLLHTADLVGWHGDRAHPGYRDVVKQVKELAGKTSVRPLKPPPNRALRALWRTVAVVGVVAAIGASVWIFRPWETFVPKDPVLEAKKEAEAQRVVSISRLAPFGLSSTDLDMHPSRYIATRLFKPEMRDQLAEQAKGGDPIILALSCAVDLWTLDPDVPSYEESDLVCDQAAATGEPVGLVVRGEQLMETSYLDPRLGDGSRAQVKAEAVALYRRAAEAGYGQGELRYGVELVDGSNVTADPVAAEALFRSAQAKGIPEADYRLGALLIERALDDQDFNAAVALVKKAADAGVQEAQSLMADHLLDSTDPGLVDLESAFAYRKSCTEGFDPYVAFRCRESLTRVEEMIAARKAPTPPAPN